MNSALAPIEGLAALLAAQKSAFNAEGAVDAAERRRRIQQVIDLLVAWHKPLAQAMDEDFGGRTQGFSLMNDVLGSLASLKHAATTWKTGCSRRSASRSRPTTSSAPRRG